MSDSLRIAYLTSTFARPSDTFIRNEVNQLRRLGLDVSTFSIRRPNADGEVDDDIRAHQAATEYLLEAGAGRILSRALFEVVRNPAQFFRAAKLACRTSAPGWRARLMQTAYLLEASYLAARLREERIGLLHNHIGENSATVAMLASELSGIPFSQTIHGPYIFFAPERWALRTKLEKATFTACISDFCRSQCMIFAPESTWPRLHIVRCSVQPEFVKATARISPSEPHFACVARLCNEKGQFVLVEAARRLVDSGRKFRISLVGDGPSRAALEKSVREFNIEGSVNFLGWQSSERIRELLSQSTALVIPSFAEGLPVVAMESLALGCPVIATNIAAMSELVEHGRNGWLIAPGDAGQLAAAMNEAIETSWSELQGMGARGRERVLALHDPVRQAELLRDLFRDAVQRR